MLDTYTSSKPASSYFFSCSAWPAGSGPHGADLRVISGVTSCEACSKCLGDGSTWDSSPGTPALAHSRCAISTPSSSVGAQQPLKPPCTGLSPAPPRDLLTRSGAGVVEM